MTQTQAIRPSLWWAALAIPFSLAGLGLAAFFMVTEIQRVGASMAYVNVPGEMDVELKKNLSYTVFLEQTLGGGSDPAPIVALKSKVRCELHALPYGDTVPMSAPSGSATYNYGARSGISFLNFSVPRDGTYVLGCQDNRGIPGSPLRIAVGAGAAEAITTAVEKSLVTFFGGGIVALLIFVRVLMLRDQSKRAIRAQGLKPV
ncbi:MAG TPA: hypothetical protein VNU20_07255 [Candidatus Sulfotelmatobacter sp.]|jgi:hypothetical protein|nr:hypothetical protein [Candidatus Sulfotelmatobacter sp.]